MKNKQLIIVERKKKKDILIQELKNKYDTQMESLHKTIGELNQKKGQLKQMLKGKENELDDKMRKDEETKEPFVERKT